MLKIGWSSSDFTPARPAMLQGQMHIRVARKARDPLTLTALAVEDPRARQAAVVVSCDLAYIAADLLREVRRRVRAADPTVPAGAIVMTATHTHTSLVYDGDFYEYPGGDVMRPAECMELLAEHAAGAVLKAWADRAPRAVGRAFGHAVVGHNRYAVYAGGKGQMYGVTNRDDFERIGGYEDHSLDMLFTWNGDGSLAGVALAIPCPSQVDENIEEYSADYWHEVRGELRRRLGAGLQVLTLCAPAGDQSPHFLLYAREEEAMRRRRGVSERQEIALRVADAVERALVCTLPMGAGAPFRHSVRRLNLTGIKITPDHGRWAAEQLRGWRSRKLAENTWYPQNLLRVIDAARKRVPPVPFEMELHAIRIGDAVIATNPFELFLDYGLRVKARSPAQQTVLVQLAGRGMYLPTAHALGSGGYGANPIVAQVGPEGGHQLVEATLKSIRTLFPAR